MARRLASPFLSRSNPHHDPKTVSRAARPDRRRPRLVPRRELGLQLHSGSSGRAYGRRARLVTELGLRCVFHGHGGFGHGRTRGRGVLKASNIVFAAGLTLLAVAPSPLVLFAGWAVIGLGMGIRLYEAGFATLAEICGKDARGPITGITLIAGFASPAAERRVAKWHRDLSRAKRTGGGRAAAAAPRPRIARLRFRGDLVQLDRLPCPPVVPRS